MQLETDSIDGGPKGKVIARIRDIHGNVIATASTSEIGIVGKGLDGRASVKNFVANATVSSKTALEADSIDTEAICTGTADGFLGINTGGVLDNLLIDVVNPPSASP